MPSVADLRSSRRCRGALVAALCLATAGAGLLGCTGVATKSSPDRSEILAGLGTDTCRIERFAAAWADESADADRDGSARR